MGALVSIVRDTVWEGIQKICTLPLLQGNPTADGAVDPHAVFSVLSGGKHDSNAVENVCIVQFLDGHTLSALGQVCRALKPVSKKYGERCVNFVLNKYFIGPSKQRVSDAIAGEGSWWPKLKLATSFSTGRGGHWLTTEGYKFCLLPDGRVATDPRWSSGFVLVQDPTNDGQAVQLNGIPYEPGERTHYVFYSAGTLVLTTRDSQRPRDSQQLKRLFRWKIDEWSNFEVVDTGFIGFVNSYQILPDAPLIYAARLDGPRMVITSFNFETKESLLCEHIDISDFGVTAHAQFDFRIVGKHVMVVLYTGILGQIQEDVSNRVHIYRFGDSEREHYAFQQEDSFGLKYGRHANVDYLLFGVGAVRDGITRFKKVRCDKESGALSVFDVEIPNRYKAYCLKLLTANSFIATVVDIADNNQHRTVEFDAFTGEHLRTMPLVAIARIRTFLYEDTRDGSLAAIVSTLNRPPDFLCMFAPNPSAIVGEFEGNA